MVREDTETHICKCENKSVVRESILLGVGHSNRDLVEPLQNCVETAYMGARIRSLWSKWN